MKLLVIIFITLNLTTMLNARIPLATQECQNLMDFKIDPEICCTLPRPSHDPQNEAICRDECSKKKKRKQCCIRRCRVEKLGIYINDTFHKSSLKKFLYGKNETKTIWEENVNQAVEICSEKCEKNSFNFLKLSISQF